SAENPLKAVGLVVKCSMKNLYTMNRPCNLCNQIFRPQSKFERFCEKCRVESELYQFSEWMTA
ncbi:MAG: hypothetical protein ACXVCH_18335, partial [Bdellovibrionota bacterium]